MIRPIAALVLTTFLHGCMQWSTVPEPRALSYKQAKEFRVTLTSGAIIVVKEPFISGDSLMWRHPQRTEQRTGVALAQVSLLEAHTVDRVATALLELAVIVPATILMLNALENCCDPFPSK